MNRIIAFFTLASLATSAHAALTVLATGSAVTTSASAPGNFTLNDLDGADGGIRDGIYSFAFNAGASSDMLVVALSYETGSGAFTVSYNGVGMSLATQSSNGAGTSIFYLANPSATGSIAIDFTTKSTVNGIGLGIASLDNTDPGGEIYFNNGASAINTATIGITTSYADSFVMFAGDANATSGTPTLDIPLTSLRASWPADIGSNQAAAGYENAVAAGSNSYSWNPGSNERGISVAAFSAIPEPRAALLGGLGLLCLLRRRR